MASKLIHICVVLSLVLLFACLSQAQLCANYYESSCPQLENIVRNSMKQAIMKETRMGASILRLFFHDCFVNGCDGSILLDNSTAFVSEKAATANQNNSARGFEVIDMIKCNVEAACPGIVSCADILALAAREGVYQLGGPSWSVLLGRRDARTASISTANANLPPPFLSLSQLKSFFARQGLSATDMTALSGGHTIGLARCTSFRAHIYNDTDIDPNFAQIRQANCPRTKGVGDTNLAPLDLQTPFKFDNDYFKNLVAKQGLLHSDQELYNGGSQDSLVLKYSQDNGAFLNDFVAAMIKMGNISPLTGTKGEIRKNCRVVN